MSSCHSLSGEFCSEKRNLAVSLTAPECFQEIIPTCSWLPAVLHLLPCRNLYFSHPSRETAPPQPPRHCSCNNYSCPLLLAFLTLKVPFVYLSCPQLLFSVTGTPLTACPAHSSGSSLLPLLLQYLGSLLPLFNSFCQLSYHCWLQKFICCRQQKVRIWSAWRCCPGCCPCLLFVCVSSCSVAS